MTVEALTYANTPRRRRWSAKWLVVLGMLTGLLVASRWYRVIRHRINVIVDVSSLARCIVPADKIAVRATGKPLIDVPESWRRFYREVEGTDPGERSVLFLQERHASNGTARLVELGFNGSVAWSGELLWHAVNFTGIGKAEISGGRAEMFCPDPAVKNRRVDLYTATADPQDLSHFSLRRVSGEDQTWIDGYLMNDGSVRLEPRPSPHSGRPEGPPVGRMLPRGDR